MNKMQPAVWKTDFAPTGATRSVWGAAGSERALGRDPVQHASPLDGMRTEPRTPRNFQAALNLLECAARVLDVLYARHEEADTSSRQALRTAEDALEAARAATRHWRLAAASLESEVHELRRQLGSMRERAESAEQRIKAESARTDAATRQAADVRLLAEALYAKMTATLGSQPTVQQALGLTADRTRRRAMTDLAHTR